MRPTRTLTGRPVTCLLAFVLIASACGDDGGSDATGPADDATTTAGGTPADGGGDATTPSAPASGGTGTATVTLATGEEFVFDEEVVCLGMGGAVSGTFRNAEGVELSIDVPPEDWETSSTGDWEAPSLTLRDERDELNWRIFESGPELAATYPGGPAEDAVITDFSVDGSHATGNGFALDTFALTRANAEGTPAPSAVPVFFGFECS